MDKMVVAPGSKVRLHDGDPAATPGAPGGKEKARQELASLRERLDTLQEVLYADLDPTSRGGAHARAADALDALPERAAEAMERLQRLCVARGLA